MVTYTSEKSEAGVDELLKQIAALQFGVFGAKFRGDLGQLETPARVVDKTQAAFARQTIDILVNNAAVIFPKPLLEATPTDMARMWDLNLRGVLLMTQAVVPHLPPRGGRIINISSVGARAGYAGNGLYCASKAGLEALTRVWAAELGEKGHTVNAVAPGPVETDILEDVSAALVKQQKESTPMEQRLGTVDDIAQVVAFLAEEGSRWITGQVVNASGGYSMY